MSVATEGKRLCAVHVCCANLEVGPAVFAIDIAGDYVDVYAAKVIDHSYESIKVGCNYKRNLYSYEIPYGIREQLRATC